MMNKCHLAENEIWERIQSGESLTPELSDHIAACPKCAGIEKEVRRIVEVMLAETVPDSPDCRANVMARVPNRPSPVRALLAYSVLAAVLMLVGFASLSSMHKSPPPQVTHHPPAKNEARKIEQQASVVPKPMIRTQVIHPNTVRMVKAPMHHRHVRTNRVARGSVDIPITKHVVIRNDVKPTNSEVAQEDAPVLAVAVSWSGIPDTSESSYSYTSTDSQTGIETTCIAKRTDDNVYIRLESKPSTEKSPT